MEFTSREIAVAVWLGIGLIFVIHVAGKSLLDLLRALTRPILLGVIGTALAYVALCVAALAYFGLWEFSNLKTTLFWVLTTASVRFGKAAQADQEAKFLARTLRETLSVAVVMEFLVENYTFSIWIELVLVPVVWFLAMLLAVAKSDKKFKAVNTLLQWVLVAIALSYIGHAISEAARHYRELATAEKARELLLPVALSLLFMPFLFGLNLYSLYEQIFGALQWGIQDEALRRYAKRQALLRFGADLEYLKRWRRLVMMERPDSREGINRLFAELEVIRRHERNPLPFERQDGWQPHAAMKFLTDEGFVNEDYHRSCDQWSSTSRVEKLGGDWSRNTITYYVTGNPYAANELVLELNVLDSGVQTIEEAEKRIAVLIAKLLTAALGAEAAAEFTSTLDSDTFDLEWRGYRFRLTREDWPNTKGGYEREFVIQTEAAWEAAQKAKAELEEFGLDASTEAKGESHG